MTEADQLPVSLYRLHIKTAGDRERLIDYCLDNKAIGVGWGMHWSEGEFPAPRSPEEWFEYASQIWPKGGKRTWEFWPVLWLQRADPGSLVWTRDTKGNYYLASIEGPWRYADEPINRELDITSVRDVSYRLVEGGEAVVPGAVVRSFTKPKGKAFEHVSDSNAAWYSMFLWAELTGQRVPSWRPTLFEVVDSLLGSLDVQDLVAAYLQAERGYIALPARQVDSTLAYEYVLRDPDDGHLAVAQVKTGGQHVEIDSLPGPESGLHCFLFSPRGHVPEGLPSHMSTIEPDDILEFIRSKPRALPPVTENWVRLVGDSNG